ncbi:hypothetical protein [Halobacteriovorax sp. HLS]|uniref:hypothetical protein n=1 Tax=Halobacteriovorax sp. HLS TaxID=2234000 RepID=UPI000FDA3C8E|nr:hypothetical protein [Halobacteriovorax sp. HLS]
MLFKSLLIVGCLGLLVSCGENWDKESDEVVENPQPAPTVYYEPVLENELVTSDKYIAELKANETLIITFTGKVSTQLFSPIYQRSYPSGWTDRECEIRGPICRHCDFLKRRICWDRRRSGSCNLKYRNFDGMNENDIIFSDNLNETKLRVKIGGNLYPLGKIIDYSAISMTTEFKVSEEMIQESSEAYLSIVPDTNHGDVRIGFLGYGSCFGHGKRKFYHGGSTASSSRKNQASRAYKVNVSFKKIK